MLLTLSTASVATLAAAWDAQAETRRAFIAHAWLSSRVASWARETEVTWTAAGWHVHDHLLLLGEPNRETVEVGRSAISRWLDSARRVGVSAHPLGQHLRSSHSVMADVRYITKGQHGQGSATGGESIGDLLARYRAGEVEAADLWHELERFVADRRPRWRASHGFQK